MQGRYLFERFFVKRNDTGDGWYLPVDAPIVSGYSGCPAFNMQGELIGISNAAFTEDLSGYGFEHLGLLIPIDRVKELIEAHCG